MSFGKFLFKLIKADSKTVQQNFPFKSRFKRAFGWMNFASSFVIDYVGLNERLPGHV